MTVVEGWRRKSYRYSLTSTMDSNNRMDGPLNVESHHMRKIQLLAWLKELFTAAETKEELAFAVVMFFLLHESLKI